MAGDKRPTRGGDMLARCADSHAEIAAKVGVDKSLVTRWISGARKPTDTNTTKLESLYGIPPAAWTEPGSKPKKKPTTAPTAQAAPTPAPPSTRARPDDGDDDDDDNAARLNRFIRDGLRELELDAELSATKKAEALKKLADAQVALARSTGENALTMSRIAQHPEFRRVVRLITEAIAPHPEVLAKVLDVLRTNP